MSLSNNNDENGEQDLSDGWSKVEDEGQSSSLSDDITRQSLNVTGESDKSVRNQSTLYLSSRANSWINLLGVRNKPDPLADWDNLYNLKNQSLLRKDCQKLIQQRSNISSRWTVPEIESLMTLYCKRRNVGYEQDKGWLEILGKLLEFPFDKCNLFNVFWAITTKYIPRSPKMFDLLRLLMQYHDPQLCSFLDSFKIQSSEFTSFWLRTLLCVNMDDDLCNLLWDRYFEKGDPFLIFFVSLAFVQSVKDEILLLTERDKILNLLKDIPSKMTRDDLTDLLEICSVHLNLTPISVREDFHCMLFGSNLLDECSEQPLNRLICLSISAQELYKRAIDPKITNSNFSYFIIDTRPQKSFNAGSISGAFNLNAETIVEDPDKFGFAMSSLLKFKTETCPKDHICFVGSGHEEEDQFMFMAISPLHSILSETGNLQKLSNHFTKNDCIECKNGPMTVQPKSEWKKSFLSLLKKSVQIKQPKEINTKENKSDLLKHVSTSERIGNKRYRNIQSVFSINEEESLSSDVDELQISSSQMKAKPKEGEKLKWNEIIKKAEIIENFEGEEVFAIEDRTLFQYSSPSKDNRIPCYIALSRTHMHIFHKVDITVRIVCSSMRHSLASILKVTSKRRFPEFLTFKFGYELPTGETHVSHVHYFILPKAGECAKAVKMAILALKPCAFDRNQS
uniref:TBC1 domain family member 23 n=1 Tax=Meloidogyne floridensis TaxID=298350 RepID=A0A915NQT5_9BILA